jgi:catechol-2,3-dioxygenase
MWTYKGIDVYQADPNGSGIRWYARVPWDDTPTLRADSKISMRALINKTLAQHQIIRIGRRR